MCFVVIFFPGYRFRVQHGHPGMVMDNTGKAEKKQTKNNNAQDSRARDKTTISISKHDCDSSKRPARMKEPRSRPLRQPLCRYQDGSLADNSSSSDNSSSCMFMKNELLTIRSRFLMHFILPLKKYSAHCKTIQTPYNSI